MDIIALPAFQDNYIWLLRQGQHAAVVDPGDADPVLAYLAEQQLQLCAILLTHHHRDHVGGVETLLARHPVPVYGPARESIAGLDHPLTEGDVIRLPALDLELAILDIPAHTAGHIAYVIQAAENPLLFCGDTLFSAGCGRLFEGTAKQLADALAKLAALDDATRVFCTHEYTLANLAFAAAAEPDNPARDLYARRCQQLRAAGEPTLPSTIALEKAINPFLRADELQIRQRLASELGITAEDGVSTLATLRAWKDRF